MPIVKPKPIILANWKMNLSVAQSVKLAKSLSQGLAKIDYADIVLLPSFTALASVAKVTHRKIILGAQDVFWKDRGAFTGEISPVVLNELGARYVLVGHSERRLYLKETNAMVSAKTLTALAHNLVPVICVGETLTERQQGQKDVAIIKQLEQSLQAVVLKPQDQIIIAYEPVWVIGTGQAVNPEEANNTARLIKNILLKLFTASQVANQFRVIYGGSVDVNDIRQFVPSNLLSGVLVGSASIKAPEFISLVKALNI